MQLLQSNYRMKTPAVRWVWIFIPCQIQLKMPPAKMASNYLTEVMDKKGNMMKIEMRADGYFNASLMCKSTNKRWDHYVENLRTKEFFDEISTVIGVPANEITQTIRGPKGGVWAHRKVLI